VSVHKNVVRGMVAKKLAKFIFGKVQNKVEKYS